MKKIVIINQSSSKLIEPDRVRKMCVSASLLFIWLFEQFKKKWTNYWMNYKNIAQAILSIRIASLNHGHIQGSIKWTKKLDNCNGCLLPTNRFNEKKMIGFSLFISHFISIFIPFLNRWSCVYIDWIVSMLLGYL